MINNNHETPKIPEGYKQTEVGIIPEDWNVVQIGELCNIFGRIGYRGYTKADIVSSDVGVLSISPSNIFDGKLDYSSGTYITLDKYNESPEIKIYEGDVLLVKTGSTYGKVGLVKGLMQKATLNPQVVVLKDRKCPDDLLAYLMQFELVRNQIEETIVGGAIPTLSQKEVSTYLVPIASNKQEQTAIANALSDVDTLIAELEKLITKKEAIKTGAMQQLLTGRTRLPQFVKREDGTPKGYKDSELGKIPEDWEIVSISQLGSIYGGLIGKSKMDFGQGNAKYIPFTNVMKNVVVDINFLDKVNVNESQNFVKKGDVLFNGSSEIPEELCFCSLLAHDVENLYLNSFCFGLRIANKNHYVPKFLVYWFRAYQGRKKIQEIAQGSTRYNISKSQFMNLGIISPSLSEQKAITQILSDMDSEIESLEKRLEKTKALKQGMMQELLTGRTRLV